MLRNKKKISKVLSMVVVMLIVLSMPLTAMADGEYTTTTTYDLATGKITTISSVSGLTGETEQVAYIAYIDDDGTISDEDIIYIDQDAAVSNGKTFTYTFDKSKIFGSDGAAKLATAVKFGAETTTVIAPNASIDATIGAYKVTAECDSAKGTITVGSIYDFLGTENEAIFNFTAQSGYLTDKLSVQAVDAQGANVGEAVIADFEDGQASYNLGKLTSDVVVTLLFATQSQNEITTTVPEGEPTFVFADEVSAANTLIGFGTSICTNTFVERGIIMAPASVADGDLTIDAPSITATSTGSGVETDGGAVRFPAMGAHNASGGKFAVEVVDGGTGFIPMGQYKTRTYMIYNDGVLDHIVYGAISIIG